MRDEDKPRFLEAMNMMALFYNVELTKEHLRAWFLQMQDWDIDEFDAAARHLTNECEYFPRPKHFADLRRSQQQTPDEAWLVALKHTESGQWRYGGSGDARVDQAVQLLGGYNVIAMTDTSKLNWTEKRFREVYEDSRDTNEAREALPDTKRIGQVKTIGALVSKNGGEV